MTTPDIAPCRVVLSSRNAKKIGEVLDLLAPYAINVVGVSKFPEVGEIEETGTTFLENASLKATTVARQLREWVIAEDSGLCVDALDGAPGLHSARFAGEQGADEANNRLLLEKLRNVPPERRTAHYRCTVVLSNPEGSIVCWAEGRCGGVILEDYRGQQGFGYDPLFLIPELHRTFGELPPVVKRHISHRARAFERFIPQLVDHLRGA